MTRKDDNLDRKRAAAAAKIKTVAPYTNSLMAMLDETKIDLILIALSGATLKQDDAA